MDKLRPVPVSSSIAARIQKIRERMFIEQLSGIPASNKEVFLFLCHQYEQQLINDESLACNGTFWDQYEEDDWIKWDDDWGDWFKLIRVINTNTRVL